MVRRALQATSLGVACLAIAGLSQLIVPNTSVPVVEEAVEEAAGD